ncbi:MAG: methyltransferase domain-containing protein [Anaerolineae bacterium]|nr:methyltransferase domain-containing protein [Anaerolineae bacterium]
MLNDPNYVKEQYGTSENLSTRIGFHQRFGTAPRRWFAWVFDHLTLPPNARVLEIGCGVGTLWRQNRAQIPPTWQLILTDLSFAMVEKTRAHIVTAHCAQVDAQAIPFPDAAFDAVIANHVLYHIPDIPRALGEIHRVLKRGGTLFAATNGTGNMRELYELFIPSLERELLAYQLNFHRDNGHAILAPYFPNARWVEYPDTLLVTQVEPLMEYATSFFGWGIIGRERENELYEIIAERIAREGAFRITKSVGIFIAER